MVVEFVGLAFDFVELLMGGLLEKTHLLNDDPSELSPAGRKQDESLYGSRLERHFGSNRGAETVAGDEDAIAGNLGARSEEIERGDGIVEVFLLYGRVPGIHLLRVQKSSFVVAEHDYPARAQPLGDISEGMIGADGFVLVMRPRSAEHHDRRPRSLASGGDGENSRQKKGSIAHLDVFRSESGAGWIRRRRRSWNHIEAGDFSGP